MYLRSGLACSPTETYIPAFIQSSVLVSSVQKEEIEKLDEERNGVNLEVQNKISNAILHLSDLTSNCTFKSNNGTFPLVHGNISDFASLRALILDFDRIDRRPVLCKIINVEINQLKNVIRGMDTFEKEIALYLDALTDYMEDRSLDLRRKALEFGDFNEVKPDALGPLTLDAEQLHSQLIKPHKFFVAARTGSAMSDSTADNLNRLMEVKTALKGLISHCQQASTRQAFKKSDGFDLVKAVANMWPCGSNMYYVRIPRL